MRNSTEIRVWMLRNGHTVDSISRALGYSNHTTVSLAVEGKRDTVRVLRWLQDKGCPVKYLDFPQKIRKAS